MGTLRFILALLVMLSHTGLTVGGLNPGVASVVVFYAISGYVMSALVAKHFSQPGQARHFYIDRLARIYPQYLFYAVFLSGPHHPLFATLAISHRLGQQPAHRAAQFFHVQCR